MINYLKNSKNCKLIIYSKKSNRPIFDNLDLNHHEIIESKSSELSVFLRVIWEQTLLPKYLIRDKIDLLFCPGNIAPIFSPVIVVQWIGTIGPFWDNIYSYKIGLLKRIKYPFNRFLMWKSAQNSNHVIFESNYTRKMFLKNYSLCKDKTSVINIGKDEFFIKKQKTDILINDNKTPYVLSVSHLYPYKNIPRMIKSFYLANKQKNHSFELLIAGAFISKSYDKRIKQTIHNLGYHSKVKLLGSVSKDELKMLYSNSEFLLFSSPCENFAYTLVEAMSLGVPVVCSNTTAMPETCGNAAIYFNPFDTDDMHKKISLILGNKELINHYKKKSLKRAELLPTFQEVTQRTLSCFYSLLNNAA